MIKTIIFDREKFDNKLELEISLKSGNIDVISEENRDTIDIDLEDLRKGTAEDIFEIKLDEVERKLIVKEKKKKESSFINNISSSFSTRTNLKIYLPKNISIKCNIKSYNGNIKISESLVSGEITCFNGNTKFANSMINCKTKIFNGNYKIEDGIIKSLKVKCFSGNISINSIFDIGSDQCIIQTLAGNIKINCKEFINSESIVELKTLSGNIKVSDSFPKDKIKINKKIDFSENDFLKDYVPPFVKGIFNNLSENFNNSFHGNKENNNKKEKKGNHNFNFTKNRNNTDTEVEVEIDSKRVSKSQHIETILKMVSDGKITVDEAEKLIKALG